MHGSARIYQPQTEIHRSAPEFMISRYRAVCHACAAFEYYTSARSAWISKTVNDRFEAYSESGSINNYQPYRYTVCLILSKTNPGTGYSRYTTLVCVSSYAVLIYYYCTYIYGTYGCILPVSEYSRFDCHFIGRPESGHGSRAGTAVGSFCTVPLSYRYLSIWAMDLSTTAVL